MSTFDLKIAASSGLFYEGPCQHMILPTKDGGYAILAGHAPTLVGIRMGEMRYQVDDQWYTVVVGDGFAEITGDANVVVVDSAERPEDIDVNRALEAKRRIEERMQHQKGIREYYQNKIALTRAMERLKVTNRRGKF